MCACARVCVCVRVRARVCKRVDLYMHLLHICIYFSIGNIDFSVNGLDLCAITTTLNELIVTNCSLKCVTQIHGIG